MSRRNLPRTTCGRSKAAANDSSSLNFAARIRATLRTQAPPCAGLFISEGALSLVSAQVSLPEDATSNRLWLDQSLKETDDDDKSTSRR